MVSCNVLCFDLVSYLCSLVAYSCIIFVVSCGVLWYLVVPYLWCLVVSCCFLFVVSCGFLLFLFCSVLWYIVVSFVEGDNKGMMRKQCGNDVISIAVFHL